MDLKVERVYNSNEARHSYTYLVLWVNAGVPQYSTLPKKVDVTNGLAPGWSFNYPRMTLTDSGSGSSTTKKYSVTLQDGKNIPIVSSYATSTTRNFSIDEKYKLQDFTIVETPSSNLKLRAKDGTIYEFGSGGISSITDRYGNTLTYSYTEGKISKIQDNAGREISFTYEDTKTIVNLPGDKTLVYNFSNASGAMDNIVLSSYMNQNGETTTYDYSLPSVTTDLNNLTKMYYAQLSQITNYQQLQTRYTYAKRLGNTTKEMQGEYFYVSSRLDYTYNAEYNKVSYYKNDTFVTQHC